MDRNKSSIANPDYGDSQDWWRFEWRRLTSMEEAKIAAHELNCHPVRERRRLKQILDNYRWIEKWAEQSRNYVDDDATDLQELQL